MKIMKVPTGKIFIIDGERGRLECLSLADYGRKCQRSGKEGGNVRQAFTSDFA